MSAVSDSRCSSEPFKPPFSSLSTDLHVYPLNPFNNVFVVEGQTVATKTH